MKNLRTIFLNRVLALVLTIVALMTGQHAWAESNWSVQYTSHDDQTNVTTFTVTRKDKTYAQTVRYRTVGLSAYAGQHFYATDGFISFDADEDKKTVTVTERTPDANTPVYKYQNGSTERQYKLEVTDRAGYLLAGYTRTMTNGTSVTGSGMFDTKDVTIQTSEYTADDRGYDNNGYKYVSASSYCTSGTQAYLRFLNAQLRMTLSFDAKENDDAYEYLQILFDNTSTCDGRSGAKDGNPGTPNLSRYMAGFEMNTGSKDDTYRNYTFPVTSAGDNASATNPWGHGDKWPLKNQKFKSGYRATDGRLIVPTDFSTLVLRLNASGSSGSDEWAAKNVIAHIQAVDATAPTKLAVSVAPGRHSKGNTVYVSVAFTEIVTSSSPKLTSNWGDLTYVAGSGTNVLTFKGTIPQNATGDLNITGISGTIQDLAGNSLSGVVTASNICTLDDDFAYTIDEFQKDGNNYLIKTHDDLIGLAGYVNGGGATEGKTFLQVADIAFAHTTNWNSSSSTENNYTAIGTYDNPFLGTFDGQSYTVSGIRIYRGGTSNSNYQGLFGVVMNNGTVKRVTLSDARITGYREVGGIAAHTYYSSIEDCIVDANVCIHAVQSDTYDHGGIVGYNQAGPVKRCISRATLTVANSSGCKEFGGIVGLNWSNIITDCIADGAVIPNVNARGAIVGLNEDNNTSLTRNYYHGCKVASDAVTPSGVGMGTESSKTTSDETGAQPLWGVTLPTHASVVRTPATDPLPGTNNMTYDNGADINGVSYAKGSSVVNLSYDPATITEGYDVLLAVKKTSDNKAVAFTDNGNHTYTIASMPAADITVTATEIPVIAYIDADGNPQSHACIPIVEGTTSYQTLGRTEGWYVVNSDVTISGTQGVKFLDQQVNIILCDGATLSISPGQSNNAICNENGSINIFAQSGGTGAITVSTACKNGISVNNSIDINGGAITVSNASNSGISASNGDVTIRRGRVDAYGSYYGIGAFNNVNILGGIVNATCGSGKSGIIAANATLTLGCSSPSDRITATSYKAHNNIVQVADGQILSDGTATYSGRLTSDEIAYIAGKTLSAAIPYIDADGTTKYKASKDLTFITISTSGTINYGDAANAEGWYCVNSDVDFDEKEISFNDQQVNIILCDGSTMSAKKTTQRPFKVNNGSLAIYGQTLGTGTLTVYSRDGHAIYAKGNIDFNGGTINSTSGYYIGILADNNITIRRGKIMAKGGSRNDFYGFKAGGTITLGCATTADRIYSTGYNGTVTIADGQTLTDGYSANTYTGPLNDDQKAAIAGKTMMKALGDVSYIDENGKEQLCSNYKILSDGILTAKLHSIGESSKDTWYVASGSYTYNATYLQTDGHVHIILCDGANFTVNGSGNYGIYATDNLSIYGQSQDTGTLTVNVANTSGKALYVSYGDLVVNGGVINANGGDYAIYLNNGSMTVNGGTFNCSANVRFVHVNGDMMMGSVLLAHHFPVADCTGTKRVKVTMNSIGIMSFSCLENLDFTNVSGLSAYVALSNADDKGNITLTRTYRPTSLTGMVLCGEPSTTYVVPTINSNMQNYQNNRLHHVIDAMEIDKTDGYWTHYILAKKNGNVGFYPLSGKGTLKPYSAYLQLHIDPIKSRGLVLNFEEEGTPTGVGHTEITESTEMADAIYDLQGRRIEKPKKGLYIVNGRKVMIK